MTADTQQVLASGAAAMPPTANAVVTGAHSWSPFGGSHPITGGGPSNGAFPTIVTGSMPGRGGPTAAEASTQGSGRTITTIRAPPNQLPSKQTVGGSATGTPTAALPQGKSDLVSLALFTSLQGSNGPDADVVAQVLQSIDNASGGSGADTCFPGGEKSIAEGEAYALRGQRKAAAGVKELLGAEAKGQEDDGDAGEDGTDDGSDDGSDEAGAKGAGARRKSNPVGRPVAYTGDPGAVELSEADRRRLKRRIANRESARRVRQKRQELMEELQLKCTVSGAGVGKACKGSARARGC